MVGGRVQGGRKAKHRRGPSGGESRTPHPVHPVNAHCSPSERPTTKTRSRRGSSLPYIPPVHHAHPPSNALRDNRKEPFFTVLHRSLPLFSTHQPPSHRSKHPTSQTAHHPHSTARYAHTKRTITGLTPTPTTPMDNQKPAQSATAPQRRYSNSTKHGRGQAKQATERQSRFSDFRFSVRRREYMSSLGPWPILSTGGGVRAGQVRTVGRCWQFFGVYHSTGARTGRIRAWRPGPAQCRPATGVQQAGGRHGMTCGRALDGRHSRFARVGHRTCLKYSRLCAFSTM